MKIYFSLVLCWLTIACSPTHRIIRTLRTQSAYTNHTIGVSLYNPTQQKFLVQYNADKPFTPASNTKLVSFYAGLLTLPDSLPALRYVVRSDSLLFWGTGNPLLLHPVLSDTTALAFLRNRPERLFFSGANYDGPRFGPGWAWDDYNDDYSTELAPLPVYGNVVRFVNSWPIPHRFADSLRIVTDSKQLAGIHRNEFRNQFVYTTKAKLGRQDVPFRWSPSIVAQLLSDTLHRPIGVVNTLLPKEARLIRGGLTDSLYKRMLHVSDNQFAEQILFMISAERGLAMLRPTEELRRMADSVLRYPATSANWVDGSGLSRYNLFTPNVLIDLLGRIYKQVPQPRLFALLAATGQAATLQAGKLATKPYIFAKSGSMSGVYNLSGYVLTRRNKLLYFSIMHNNFTQVVSEIRRQTVDLLKQIHEAY